MKNKIPLKVKIQLFFSPCKWCRKIKKYDFLDVCSYCKHSEWKEIKPKKIPKGWKVVE